MKRTLSGPARRGIALAAVVAVATLLACVGPHYAQQALRLSDLADEGDAARRASLRLVDEGLASDADQQPGRAMSRYERAIQIDPTNPYAYLAIARHHVQQRDPDSALEYVDQAAFLLESHGELTPAVEPHLVGLRGAALQASGRTDEGSVLLVRAGDLAPAVWGDGTLSAEELR